MLFVIHLEVIRDLLPARNLAVWPLAKVILLEKQ
jgi:hypothetical protein